MGATKRFLDCILIQACDGSLILWVGFKQYFLLVREQRTEPEEIWGGGGISECRSALFIVRQHESRQPRVPGH